MSTLDLRNEEGSPVDEIVFGKTGDYLTPCHDNEIMVCLVDHHTKDMFELLFEDIPCLIKALQKAQELWGPKE